MRAYSRLVAIIYANIKGSQSNLGFLILDILFTIIYLPKFIYHLLKKEKFICFDWGNGTYKEFYLPLVEKLDKIGIKIIFFFNFGYKYQLGSIIYKKGLPRVYRKYIDNKIILSAMSCKYKSLKNTVRIQIFHGPVSLGSVYGKEFIDDFDVLFMVTKYQYKQCMRGEYKKVANGKKILKIGYCKIDKYVTMKRKNKSEVSNNKTTIFYGPTYHREISSVFKFFPEIVKICRKNNFKLIIKLHPFLYYKNSYDHSGGVDWFKRIYKYKRSFNDIVLLKNNDMDIVKYFTMTDVFLTDCSTIGFDFVLSTGKPIIFLGDKIKIPLKDLRKGNIQRYEKYPEIYYRGMIGPIVKQPTKLEDIIKKVIEENGYNEEIKKFQQDYIFNLGTATDIAVSEIIKIYEEL